MEDSDNIVRRRESPPLAKEKEFSGAGKGKRLDYGAKNQASSGKSSFLAWEGWGKSSLVTEKRPVCCKKTTQVFWAPSSADSIECKKAGPTARRKEGRVYSLKMHPWSKSGNDRDDDGHGDPYSLPLLPLPLRSLDGVIRMQKVPPCFPLQSWLGGAWTPPPKKDKRTTGKRKKEWGLRWKREKARK